MSGQCSQAQDKNGVEETSVAEWGHDLPGRSLTNNGNSRVTRTSHHIMVTLSQVTQVSRDSISRMCVQARG